METDRSKKPASRLPITRENVQLGAKPPAPRQASIAPIHQQPSAAARIQQVSLTADRSQRTTRHNIYVDTPHKPLASLGSDLRVIDRQPTPLIKTVGSESEETCDDSIICKRCQRCKCKQCAAPRELPKGWCATNEVSAPCVVEYCTCMKCVKCCFDVMNINDREHDNPLSDQPCACCAQPHCCKRWTYMGLLSLICPCLCFYPFLHCGLLACTACYSRARQRGCTCNERTEPGSKRLIEHENSSST